MFLEISGIRKSFGAGDSRVEVLKGIDLSIEKGEFCVLLGPSGSGKSTLLNIIGGIDTPDSGDISIRGEKMADMNERRLTLYRRKHLGYIFQMYNLIPNLTVRENIEVGAYLSDKPLEIDELLHTLGLFEHRRKLTVLLYLLGKIIIEKNAQSISISKILGYSNPEISGLYIVTTSVVVVLLLLFTLPIESFILIRIFRIMITQMMSGWMPLVIEQRTFVQAFLMGVGVYAVVAVFEYRKVRKVPMGEALKNIE